MTNPPTTTHRARRPGGDGGHVTAFVVVITGALLLLAGLVLDAGLALATRTRALNVAHAAARTGAQQLDLVAYRVDGTVRLDPAAAEQAARDYLADTGYSGTVTSTDDTVTVQVRARHRTQILTLLGIRSLTVTASATATPRHGVTGPDDAGTPP